MDNAQHEDIEMDVAEASVRAVQAQRPGLRDLTSTHHGLRNGLKIHGKASKKAGQPFVAGDTLSPIGKDGGEFV